MDEKLKSLWKKSFTGRTALVTWLAVAVFAVMLGCYIIALGSYNGPMSGWLMTVMLFAGAFLVACLFLIYLMWPLLRWLFWKHWRRTLFALACFATLIALLYAEENWRGKHDLEKFKREWEAKGEKFDYASVVPPPVPDDQNFALTPIGFSSYGHILTRDGRMIPADRRDTNFVARIKMPIAQDDIGPTNGAGARNKGRLTDLARWQGYYRDLAAKTNQFPVPAQPQSPAADVLLALSIYDAAIEELRSASALSASRFPLNYNVDEPFAILLPHLTALKSCSKALQLRSIAELQANQPEKALSDVTLALQLTDKIRSEPFLISHLVRIAMLEIALQPVWEGLAEQRWSNEQLVALGAELERFDLLADYKLAMRGEMGCTDGTISYMLRNRREIFNLTDQSKNGPGFIGALIPSGWFYQNQLRCDRVMVEVYIPQADMNRRIFPPAAARHADKVLQAETKTTTPFNLLEKMLLPALGNAVKKFAYEQNAVDLARVAIALERYRLAHEEFPESLDALVPQLMEKIPHDIINGQPLHYRRTDDGQFVLYSVGWNETDDGGVVGFKEGKTPAFDINQGDWVWRYPAK